jgi:hypothetical protein
MVHDILPSDVELARGMLDSGHSDAEAVAFLASRGVEPAKALELLDDLRLGRTPNAQIFSIPGASDHADAAIAGTQPLVRRHRHHRHKHSRREVPWWFVCLAVIFLLSLIYCLLEWRQSLVVDRQDRDIHAIPRELDKHYKD